MTERLPAPGRVRRELERLEVLTKRLQVLTAALGEAYEEAYEAGLTKTSSEPAVLGRNFAASDPTGQTAMNAQLRQLRWRAGKAARCVTRSIASLEEGVTHLADGFLHLDEQEWARWVAKRIAATEG